MRPLDKNTIAAKVIGTRRMALRKVVFALGGAGLVGALMAGCASPEKVGSAGSSELMAPQVRAMGLVTRSAQTPEGYYDLGKYYFWQNRFDKARDAFIQALRLNPESVDILNGLGATYDKSGQYEAAQQAYQAALLKNPEAGHVLANMGYSLLLQGKNDKAADYLRQALRLDPSDRLAQMHLAQAEGGKTDAGMRIVSENPQPLAQAGNDRSKQPAAAPEPVGIIKNVIVADSSGSASLSVRPLVVEHAFAGKQDAESAGNAPRASVSPTQNMPKARLEISNGIGVTGLARAVGAELRKQGENVGRVTNKKPYDSPRTLIICNSEAWGEQAKILARQLPNSPKVVFGSIAHRGVDIRVILGADAALAWKGNGVKSVLVAAI